MAPLNITGDNLGERHRHFNALVNEAITNKLPFVPTLVENDDLNNLLKIDIASTNRNVDFILEVYKCEDMLYVSRALKRTTWLITDNKYAHIIQLNYLYNELFPLMTTRAVNKLLLNIRLHLKDEARVEEFYNYVKVNDQKAAFKWLSNCSIRFIENEVCKYKNQDIPNHILKRLFERSFTIFEAYVKQNRYLAKHQYFLASQNTDKYMDILETMTYTWRWDLSRKIEKHLMKLFPERILNKIDTYYYSIDTAIIAKYVRERQELREIFIKNAKDDKGTVFFREDNISHWMKLLPKENTFEIIKKYIIMKEEVVNGDDLIELCIKGVQDQETVFEMYKYAPFAVAFEDLKKLIRTESTPTGRNSILLVLLIAAGNNMRDLKTLLQYYYEKHVNTSYKFKIEFINAFISQTNTHAFDDETWEILNKLFHSAEVYMNSENNVKHCIDAIIVRNVIRGMEIPSIIKSKFVFSSLKAYKKKLKNQLEKDLLFAYLLNYIKENIKLHDKTTKENFCQCLSSLNKLLGVLKDWNKNLSDYPDILCKIKKFIEINKNNNYKVNLSTFYNVNKQWRRIMFEESIILAPSDKVLVNVIKHDVKMLDRHKEEIIEILSNDNISLKQMFRKIRIFWPYTIAEGFKTLYKDNIESSKGIKAAVTGYCSLVPLKELKEMIEKYVPSESKIDWNETDENVYNLQKSIAKALHKARPLVPIDFILLYAKGDYLQYAVPSLCAVLSQLSAIKSRQSIPKLLNAPVSLQKFGFRYPFKKLNSQHLIPLASEIWSCTKNLSIRSVLVSSIHSRLCQERDETQIMSIWRTLSRIIDDLSCDENNNIYQKLTKVKSVPHIIRPEYVMKVYIFLDSLSPKVKFNTLKDKMKANYITEVMELLDDDFVIDFLLNDTLKTIQSKHNLPNTDKDIIAAFILSNKDEKAQVRRYNKFLAPLLDSCLAEWTVPSRETSVRTQIQALLRYIPQQFSKITVEKKINMPYKVLSNIQSQLEGGLSYEKNYIFLTYWKLTVEIMRLLYKFKQDVLKVFDQSDDGNIFNELNKIIISSLGDFCAKTLKEDLKKFYPSVYRIFTIALKEFRDEYRFVFGKKYLNFIGLYKHMLENADEADVEIYLAVYLLLEHEMRYNYSAEKEHIKEIQEVLLSQPSPELKMHYYNLFTIDLDETD